MPGEQALFGWEDVYTKFFGVLFNNTNMAQMAQTLSEPFLYFGISKPPHGTNAPCGGFNSLYLHGNIAENKLLKNQILCSFFISIHFIYRNRKERILVSNSLY